MQFDRVCYTVISDTPWNYLSTIQNPAVYLSGARIRLSPTLVPRLLSVIHLNIGRRFARSGGCPKAPGSVLLTVLGVGVSCRISYSAVSYLYVKSQSHIHDFRPGRATVHPDLASR